MSDIMMLKELQDLIPFKNKNQVIEILVRNKDGKIKLFQKVAIDNLPQNEVKEKVQEAINLLNKNNEITEKSIKLLNGVTKLSKLNLVLSGLNLCATCVGFAIMYQKLDKLSGKIDSIVNQMKKTNSIQANFEFDKILSEYSNMLDCRRKQNNYSEDQLRKLVADEYDVLNMLIRSFQQDTVSDTEEIIFSILSLASMLSVSLKYFDETYYFNNKGKIQDGNSWHMDHSKWVGIFDRLLSWDIIKAIQDHGFLELELNTTENDCYYISFLEQVRKLKQDVEDNQVLIESTDDQELYNTIISELDQQIIDEIESELKNQGVNTENEAIKNAMQAAVA